MKASRVLDCLIPLVFACIFISCASPTSTIEHDIDDFKKAYPDRIVTFSKDNHSIRYAWSGNPHKRAIIFIHGSPGSWEGWAHFLMDPSLQKDYQLFAVDRPGYGGSDPGNTEISIAKQGKEIIELLNFNQSHEKAILVGHSFGGAVIARMAMDYSEKIAGLVFLASSVSPDLEKTKWFQYPASWWPIRLFIPTSLRVCNEEIFALKDELIQMLPRWSGVLAKSVIVQGDDDDLVPPENLDFLVEHLPPKSILKIVKVPGLNHFIPWKRPDLVLDALSNLQ